MKRVAGAALLALLLAACSSFPRPRMLGPTDAEQREYDAAIATARKDPTLGRARLASFLERNPDSTLADDAVLPLARLEVKAGKPQQAEEHLRAVLRKHPKDDRADAVRLRLAELLIARGEKDEAWRIASQIQPSLLRDDERRDADRLLANLARDRGDTAAQLEWLGRLRTTTKDEAEAASVDQEIDAAIAPLPADALVKAAERLGRREPAQELWLRAGEKSLRAGDKRAASRAFAEAERLPLTPAETQQLARLQTLLQSGVGGPVDRSSPPPPPLSQVEVSGADPHPAATATGAIGVVIPLSGPLGKVAEDVLRGVLLAADTFGGDPSQPGLRVLVRDSAGKPERAAAAVRELGASGQVGAVVGPLTKEEVEAAGVAAEEVSLPLLTLTRHEGVARDRPEVVRFGLTRRMEAEVLADHAVLALGLGRMAILYPKDEYGREFEALLWQAIEARGGRIVSVSGYDPNATDFAKPIERLLGPQATPATPPGPQTDLDAPSAPAPPPLVDFDAIFIPDSADKVGPIAVQLAAAQVNGVKLLGTSGWQNPELLRTAGTHVDGAFFSSGFDPSHPSPLVQDFVARYRAAYGREPTPFAAQGFDAANLVGLQLLKGAHSALDVRNGLVATDNYPGVSGVTSIGSDGDARKRPFLLEVRGGQMVSLE